MKKSNNLLLTSLAITLSLPTTSLATSHDWSGIYVGGLIGRSVQQQTSNNALYSNDGGTPLQGWSQNYFQGSVYNSAQTMAFPNNGFYVNRVNTITLSPWNAAAEENLNRTIGTALIGTNIETRDIIIGGELKLTFGNFGSTSIFAEDSSGTKSGQDFEGTNYPFTFTNYDSIFSGITAPQPNGNFPAFSVTYQQTGLQQDSIAFHDRTSLVARIGRPFGHILVYGLGGVSYAKVKASTRTIITETASGQLTGTTTIPFSAQKSYTFSGSNTQWMTGKTLGIGLDWAINEHIALRIEHEYHNLGTISVTGVSTDTPATYSVRHAIVGRSISTGMILKI